MEAGAAVGLDSAFPNTGRLRISDGPHYREGAKADE